MHITHDNRLKKLIVIGDRVLIKPTKPDERTVTVDFICHRECRKKKKCNRGSVIKTGPELCYSYAAGG